MQNVFDLSYKDLNTGEKWIPRDWQVEVIKRFRNSRYICVTVSRQTGKSEICRLLLHDFLVNYDKRKNPKAIVTAQTFKSINQMYYGQLHKQLEHLPQSLISLKYNKNKEEAEIKLKRPWLGDECTIYFGSASSEAVANRFRGNTIDFVLLDEYAYAGSDMWLPVFSPFLDETDGKAIITSTVNGPNFYMDLENYFYSRMLDEDKWYSCINLNIYEAKTHNEGWINSRKRDFEGKEHVWRQEYMNDYYAGASSEYPLGESFAQREDLVVTCPDHNPMDHGIVVSVDIGAPGNMATWCVMRGPGERKGTIVKYEDKYNGLEELLDDLWKTFKDYREIQVVWPHDAKHPSITLGGTQIEYIWKITTEKRYRKMRHHVIDKTQNKLSIWRETIRDCVKFNFADFVNVKKGLKKLKSFKFHKDPKTKIVEFGKVTKNGSQHAADSFAYLIQSLDIVSMVTSRDGYHPGTLEQLRGNTQNADYRERENTTYYRK